MINRKQTMKFHTIRCLALLFNFAVLAAVLVTLFGCGGNAGDPGVQCGDQRKECI